MAYPIPAVDTHTHTVLSGHAFSTLLENVREAKAKGLYGLCHTEHGVTTPGAPASFVPIQQRKSIPQFVEGVRVYCGVECNIIEYDGTLDVPEWVLTQVEMAIASFHNINVNYLGTPEEVTAAYMAVLQNPYIDIIGHPDSPDFAYDIEAVAKEAARLGKILECNCNSLTPNRKGSRDNVALLVDACRRNGTRMTVGSDAHFCTTVGDFENALRFLEEMQFPPELIVTRTPESFEGYLAEREERIRAYKENNK